MKKDTNNDGRQLEGIERWFYTPKTAIGEAVVLCEIATILWTAMLLLAAVLMVVLA